MMYVSAVTAAKTPGSRALLKPELWLFTTFPPSVYDENEDLIIFHHHRYYYSSTSKVGVDSRVQTACRSSNHMQVYLPGERREISISEHIVRTVLTRTDF